MRPLIADRDERLARCWVLLGVGALATGALAAMIVAGARTPWLATVLPLESRFGTALVAHVDAASLVWPLAFACTFWAVASPLGWGAWGVALLGCIAMIVTCVTATPAVVLSNYILLADHPWFLSGLAWFGFGVALTLAQRAGRTDGGFAAACWPAALAFLLLGWSFYALEPSLAFTERAEQVFWGPGHLLQFVYATLTVAAWIRLIAPERANEPILRRAVLLTWLPALAAIAIAALYPVESSDYRRSFTILMALGSWPGPLLAAAVLAHSRGAARSSYGYASMLLFTAGAMLGSMIRGETTAVPAHYHCMVGAATLACMGVVQEFLRIAPGRRDRLPWAYAIGFGLFVAGLALAGGEGAPRKAPDGALTVAAAAMTIMGAGASLAIGAVLVFVMRVVSGLRRVPPRAAQPVRRDRRARLATTTALAVTVVGALIALWPSVDGAVVEPPAEVRVRFNQGVVMLHARQYEHALTAFHRVLHFAPAMPEAHVNMGFALIGLARYKEAKGFFESAIGLRRDQLNAYYGLATALDALGDTRGAIGAMRSYAHLARADDPFRRKAEAALWEWEAAVRAGNTAR